MSELRWFHARYSSGNCMSCGGLVHKGDRIALVGDQILGDCCEEVRHDLFDDPGPQGVPGRADDPFEEPARRTTVREVMPPGRTARDACPRCFIVHTIPQGDECQ